MNFKVLGKKVSVRFTDSPRTPSSAPAFTHTLEVQRPTPTVGPVELVGARDILNVLDRSVSFMSRTLMRSRPPLGLPLPSPKMSTRENSCIRASRKGHRATHKRQLVVEKNITTNNRGSKSRSPSEAAARRTYRKRKWMGWARNSHGSKTRDPSWSRDDVTATNRSASKRRRGPDSPLSE